MGARPADAARTTRPVGYELSLKDRLLLPGVLAGMRIALRRIRPGA